ncbi:hypothetical protein BH10BAC2_BH10BAC2_15380 [soil metagenome]
MDRFLYFLESIICYLHIITALLIILKAVMAFKNRGGSFPAVVTSFFRIYSKSDFYMSSNQGRRQYMIINNTINYYIYTWVFLSIIFFVAFRRFC